MKKSYILIFFIGINISVLGQVSPLYGKVTMQNSLTKTGHIQPVVLAQVKSGLTTTTNTISDGSFKLEFIMKEPGEDVELVITKKGLEVVNKEKCFTQLRSIQDKGKFLNIYMCKKGEWEENAKQYYKINDLQITKGYNKQIEKLRNKNLATKEQIAKLNKEKEYALNIAKELSEKFAKENLDEGTDLFNNAFLKFKKGDVKGAIEVLDENKLQSNYKIAMKQIEDGNSAIKQIAADYIFKARLLITDLQFESAEYNYSQAIKKDPNNFSILIEVANYLTFRNKFDDALDLYQKILSQEISKDDSAAVYSKMGSNYLALKNRLQAHNTFSKSLNIYINLFKNDSVKYLPHIAMSYENIATTYLLQDSIKSSLQYFEKAEKNYDLLVKTDSIYNLNIANILLIKSYIYKRKNKNIDDIMSNMFNTILVEEPLKKYSQIVDFIQKIIKRKIADSIYVRTIDLMQKSKIISDTLVIPNTNKQIELLHAQTKQLYGIALITYLKNVDEQWEKRIMITHDSTYTYELALKLFKDTDSTLQVFAKENAQTFKPLLANNLFLLGQSFYITHDTINAFNSWEKSVQIYSEVSKDNPKAYLSNLAFGQSYLSQKYLANKNYQNALDLMQEALKNAKVSINEDTLFHDLFVFSISSKLNDTNGAYFKQYPDRFSDQKDYIINNAESTLSLAEKYKDKLTETELGEAKYYLNLFKNATKESLKNLKELDSLYYHAYDYKTKGEQLFEQDKKNDALLNYDKSVIYFNALITDKKLKGAKLLYDLCQVHFSIAYASDLSQIKVLNQSQGVQILQDLILKNPRLTGELVEMKGNLSFYLILDKNFIEAIKQAKEALALDNKIDWINTNLALAYLCNGNYGKAKKIYLMYKDKDYRDGSKSFKNAFLDDLNTLEKLNFNNPDTVKIRELLK
jgi:tetratricopeptide (TPR) repeat protein